MRDTELFFSLADVPAVLFGPRWPPFECTLRFVLQNPFPSSSSGPLACLKYYDCDSELFSVFYIGIRRTWIWSSN